MALGARVFKEIIKVKCGHKGGTLIQQDRCLYTKKEAHQRPLSSHLHRGKAMRRPREKGALYKPGRESSAETRPAGILILDFWPLELWTSEPLLSEPPGWWCSMMAAPDFGSEKWGAAVTNGLKIWKWLWVWARGWGWKSFDVHFSSEQAFSVFAGWWSSLLSSQRLVMLLMIKFYAS